MSGPPFDAKDLSRGVESGAVVAAAVFHASGGAPDPLCSNWTLAYKVPGGKAPCSKQQTVRDVSYDADGGVPVSAGYKTNTGLSNMAPCNVGGAASLETAYQYRKAEVILGHALKDAVGAAEAAAGLVPASLSGPAAKKAASKAALVRLIAEHEGTTLKAAGAIYDAAVKKEWLPATEDVMLELMRAKFSGNDRLRRLLLSTADAPLYERVFRGRRNHWTGKGGAFGRLLTRVRGELREQ